MNGRFIAFVGPSGVGKDSVMAATAARDPRIVLARRVITRRGDAGGEAFDEIDAAAFARHEAAGAFALSWAAHGLRYGIPASVERDLQSGRDVFANLSRSVLPHARSRFARFDVVLLTADRTALAARLAARGRETGAQIAARLPRADWPLPAGIDHHVIDNSGALNATVDAVLARLYPVGAQ